MLVSDSLTDNIPKKDNFLYKFKLKISNQISNKPTFLKKKNIQDLKTCKLKTNESEIKSFFLTKYVCWRKERPTFIECDDILGAIGTRSRYPPTTGLS